MGLDLRLLIVDGKANDWGFSYSMLECNRDYSLFNAIGEQVSEEIPLTFKLQSYVARRDDGKSWYGLLESTDAYGHRRRWLRADALAKAFADSAQDLSSFNRAIGAFVKNLSPDRFIVLDWH